MIITIVGAGPVGLTAAIELTRRGHEVTVLDQADGPANESRAFGINPRTLDILTPAGVTPKLLAEGYQMQRLRLHHGTRYIGSVPVHHLPHQYNFMLILPQARTEALLQEQLVAQGTIVNWQREVTAVEQTQKGYEISLTDTANDEGHSLETDLLIGADGAGSVVRKSLGLDFDGVTDPDVFSMMDVEFVDHPFPPNTGGVFFNEGLHAYFPISDNGGRLISSRPNLLENLPFNAEIAKITWESTFKISYCISPSMQAGNGFIVGDAAHLHSPVGARGMNTGIEDAATLAWLIHENRTAEFNAMRHPIARGIVKQTQSVTRLALSDSPLRNIPPFIVPLVANIPWLGGQLLKRGLGLGTKPIPWLADRA